MNYGAFGLVEVGIYRWGACMGCDFLCKKCGSEEINKPAAYGEKIRTLPFFILKIRHYMLYMRHK